LYAKASEKKRMEDGKMRISRVLTSNSALKASEKKRMEDGKMRISRVLTSNSALSTY
jgi:hypothetical protein